MTPEKKEKLSRKLDKMMDFIDEFKECLESSEEYDDDLEDPEYRSMRRRDESSYMRSRYKRNY
jgi:transcription elongation GreA/GreB family factor